MLKKSQKKFISLIAMIIMLTPLLSACGNAKDETTIRIGVLAPLSGTEAFYGNDMLNAYKLAVDEINADGGLLGRKLVLSEADDGADPNMAIQAAAKIISNNVDFVVGGYASGATIPTLQQFSDADLMLLISCANSTRITEAGFSQTFMINSPGSHAVITLTNLVKSLGSANVALIHQGDDYSKNLSDLSSAALTQSGINIACIEVMEKDQADVSAIVTNIISSGADFVYWCGYHADGSNVIKQLRRGGYNGHIAVGDGSASPDLIVACGAEGEGVYVTSPPFVEFAVGGEKFVTDYTAKFGTPPGNYASLSYDTIYLLKAAIEKAGTLETAAVRDAVQSIEFQGLSGLIRFTPDREPELSNFMVLKIENGNFVLINI